jgi:cobalt/nickel transport system permease protein/cobalt/nickel transport protein
MSRGTTGVPTRTLLLAGVLVALLLAGVVSFYASGSPDGLNRVAEDEGFSATETEHASSGSPVAGYETRGVDDDRVSTAVAGMAGALVVLVLAGGLALAVRRRGGSTREDDPDRVPAGS